MILSVYSAADSQSQKPNDNEANSSADARAPPLVLPLEGEARMDHKVYVAQGKLVQSEQELSKIMASVHNTLIQHLIRQSCLLVQHDHPPTSAANVDELMTKVQARLMTASENRLNTTTSATPLQRKLAHGTYTLYLRATVATWQCIMSVANHANQDMIEIDGERFMQDVLKMPVASDVVEKTASVLHTYHERVQECTAKIENLRKAAMQKLWHGHGNVTIPLELHVNMFKNYLSQVRAWLQHQPKLALP